MNARTFPAAMLAAHEATLTPSVRTKLIAELADEIACGTPSGKYDASFFLETLLDSRRVTPTDLAILLTQASHTDAHINVSDRVRELVEAAAVKFFTDTDRGQLHVSDLLAEQARDRADDAETERGYRQASA